MGVEPLPAKDNDFGYFVKRSLPISLCKSSGCRDINVELQDVMARALAVKMYMYCTIDLARVLASHKLPIWLTLATFR